MATTSRKPTCAHDMPGLCLSMSGETGRFRAASLSPWQKNSSCSRSTHSLCTPWGAARCPRSATFRATWSLRVCCASSISLSGMRTQRFRAPLETSPDEVGEELLSFLMERLTWNWLRMSKCLFMSVASTKSIMSVRSVRYVSRSMLWRKLYSLRCRRLNEAQRWWFSRGELSLYLMASGSATAIRKSFDCPGWSVSCTTAARMAASICTLRSPWCKPPRVSIWNIDCVTSAAWMRLW
mmetsp:Transcript_11519/g.27343  ORF Transcript_11519/g.27343 Transcript_11519/m.27343 type:complete len:238 (+) Transcript_11519:167-880(+)